jgi:hypothetical protein
LPFLDVLTEIGVLLFIVEKDECNLQRLLSYFILTQHVLRYRLSMPKDNAKSKKQLIVPAITAALVLTLAPTMAFAQNPHFIGQPDCEVDNDGNLDCSGRLAGLGNVEGVDANLVADVTATFACDNPGPGVHIPPGQPTDAQEVEGDTETLPVRNGQARFSLSIDAPEPSEGFECPNERWTVVLEDVEYSNVRVEVDGETLPIPGTF